MNHQLTIREVLDLTTSIGYHIIKNGGEINRAEDTATRIGKAYGMDQVHVFAVSATIIISVEKNGVTKTQSKRVNGPSTNLDRIEQLNRLSRKICEETPGFQEVMAEIAAIESRHCYSKWMMVLCYALVGGAFAVFFGGALPEFLVGLFVGALVRLVMWLLENLKAASFLMSAIGSAVMVTAVKLVTLIYPGLNADATIAGVVMNLVPGVLLTNCIRDIIATDYNAGMAKLVEAIFISCSIALGVAVSVLWR